MTPEDFERYDRGLHEIFAASQVILGTSAYSWSMAPDITITEDAGLLRAGQDRPFVMTQAAFVEWATPQVERAEKVKVLRDRWDRDTSALQGRRKLDDFPNRPPATPGRRPF